jgi:hypothetical protein
LVIKNILKLENYVSFSGGYQIWNISSSSFSRSAKFLAFFWVKNSLYRLKSDFSGQKISRFCQNISMPYDNGEYNKIQRLAY